MRGGSSPARVSPLVKQRAGSETMVENKICRKCGVVLNGSNWYIGYQKKNKRICKKCNSEQARLWRQSNPEKVRATSTKQNRKQGKRPFDENHECAQYLGVHVAERVLSLVFKDVERMSITNHGYDFICNHGKKIDVKSSCRLKDHKSWRWRFDIRHNTIADYFLCIAFDNRDDLNPLHTWLIPGHVVSSFGGAGISPNTIHKWDAYRLDVSKISACCDMLR